MKPIIELNEDVRQRVHLYEKLCEQICDVFSAEYKSLLKISNAKLVVELVRTLNHCPAEPSDIFLKDYHSYIEIGIDINGDFHSTATLSIWKCKQELFCKVGYITDFPIENFKFIIQHVIEEMICDLNESQKTDDS